MRRHILLNYNLYVEEYDDIITAIKKRLPTNARLLKKLWNLKKDKKNMPDSDFNKLYNCAKEIYFNILSHYSGGIKCQKK